MRVNVDSSALTDPRIRRLGLRLGVPWRRAFGHLISVWMLCYDRRSNTVSCEDADISAELEGFAIAMVAADLAIQRGDKIKVRGVDERISFLNRQKERAVKGGRPKNPRVSQKEPNGLADENPTVVETKPNSPALAPDLDQALTHDQDQREREHARATPPVKSEAQTVWDYAGTVHAETRKAVNPSAPNWPALVSGLGASDLRDRIRECVDREPDRNKALEICKHAVDVCAARAKAARSMQYFTPARVFESKSFWLSAESTVEEQTKSACKKTAVNDIRYGRAEPLPSSAFIENGEQEF